MPRRGRIVPQGGKIDVVTELTVVVLLQITHALNL